MKTPLLTFTLFTATILSITVLRADDVLSVKYDPSVTTLKGIIIEQPYGEDAPLIQQGRSAWILKLKTPVSVEAKSGDEIAVAENNITEIHLNIDHSKFPIKKSEFGKTIFVATGVLYHAHTAHHLRPIVMLVSELKAEQGAAANP